MRDTSRQVVVCRPGRLQAPWMQTPPCRQRNHHNVQCTLFWPREGREKSHYNDMIISLDTDTNSTFPGWDRSCRILSRTCDIKWLSQSDISRVQRVEYNLKFDKSNWIQNNLVWLGPKALGTSKRHVLDDLDAPDTQTGWTVECVCVISFGHLMSYPRPISSLMKRQIIALGEIIPKLAWKVAGLVDMPWSLQQSATLR